MNYNHQRIAERFLQVCIYILIFSAWYVTVVQVGVNWLIILNGDVMFGCLYIVVMSIFVLVILSSYTYIAFFGNNTPPLHPPGITMDKPYECTSPNSNTDIDTNSTLNLRMCEKDGRYIFGRTRHCTICGVCRDGFDHHCPWVGNCITLPNTLAPFLLLTITTPTALLIGITPIWNITKQHFELAKAIANTDIWIRQVCYWDWKVGYWMLLGGPLGKPIWSILLGYWISMKYNVHEDYPGRFIEEPNIVVVSVIGFVLMLSGFCVVLLIMNIWNITRGQTSWEQFGRSRSKGTRFVCIPANSSEDECGEIVRCDSKERIYDHGWRENWIRFFRNIIIGGTVDCDELSPIMLARMKRKTT